MTKYSTEVDFISNKLVMDQYQPGFRIISSLEMTENFRLFYVVVILPNQWV